LDVNAMGMASVAPHQYEAPTWVAVRRLVLVEKCALSVVERREKRLPVDGSQLIVWIGEIDARDFFTVLAFGCPYLIGLAAPPSIHL
jgi:hypothetical protein